MRELLFIVPAFNEAEAIADVIHDLRSVYPDAAVLVVNDGSTDSTALVAHSEGALVAELPYNLGIGSAVQTGFIFAVRSGKSIAVQFDGDRQHIAEEVAKVVDPIAAGTADVVVGSRFAERKRYRSPLSRRLGIYIFSKTTSLLTGHRITDSTSGFRAYNRNAIEFLARNYPHDYAEPESLVTLSLSGFRITEVPVDMRPRQGGRSSITFVRSVYYVFKVMIAIIIGATRPKKENAS